MKLKFLKLTQQYTNKYFLAESSVLLTNFTVPNWHIWQLSRIFCNDLLLVWIHLTLFSRTRGIFRSVDGDCALGTDEWTNFLNYGIGTIALFPRIPAAPGKLWNLIPKRPGDAMHAAIRVVWDRLYAISQYLPTDILVCLPLRYIGIFIQSEAIRKQIILRKITLAFSSPFFFFF